MRLLLFLSLLSTVHSLKFLAYSTQFARSHSNFIARLSDVLVESGHEVTLLAPVLAKSIGGPFAKKAKVISVPQCEEARVVDDFLNRVSANIWVMKHSVQMIKEKKQLNAIKGHACLSVIDTPGLSDSLKAEKFDAAFSESADLCGPILFHLLGIDKWAATESVAIRDGFEITQTPSNPAYVPTLMAGVGEAMTFCERLSNSFSFIATQFMISTVYSGIESAVRERLPRLPPVKEILATNSLVFLNSEPLVDFPKPSSARIIDIGGITVTEEGYNPLNETWSSILDLRPKTILLSFGSMARAFTMPEEYKRTIIETFKKFPDVTFIWKYEERAHHISFGVPNLIESTWVPQNDLLHDDRLSAFITHCGQGSTSESIDAGIPVIVIPILADQLRNSHQVERNGIGIRLEKGDLAKEGRLEEAIKEILTNDGYREKARKVQQMVADRPFPMKEIFVRNMEFLGKHGPLRQLDHYGRHLNFFQYYLIDVISFVLIFISAILSFLFIITRFALRRIFRSKAKQE
ncbi:hypothetical protein PMAYCL1PPCAC_17359 [Pristionchus mayeri]|uniref:UDP-glucuronosyltransferase n=1 Tax=Pristionchus mayeri TaxID=1317129 RepID=A0AAN5CMJ5_9BILA|nr:hypothetical protein PMAYCL1PPCAC_17359 [Pristionchus mayeri]